MGFLEVSYDKSIYTCNYFGKIREMCYLEEVILNYYDPIIPEVFIDNVKNNNKKGIVAYVNSALAIIDDVELEYGYITSFVINDIKYTRTNEKNYAPEK